MLLPSRNFLISGLVLGTVVILAAVLMLQADEPAPKAAEPKVAEPKVAEPKAETPAGVVMKVNQALANEAAR